MPLLEREVLKPKDRSLTDENDWEEFLLSNAHVRDADGHPISLLSADAVSPVTVVGRLGSLSREQAHLMLLQPRASQVEIPGVTRFAYGQYEDGEIAIWAAGDAGWFKIRPSKGYSDIFDGMVEAITVLYYLADVYREGAVDGSAKAIFKQYAKENSDKFGGPKAVTDMIYGHREFLILSMLRGKELQDPPWIYTDIFLHLKSTFPDDYRAMKRKNDGKAGPGPGQKAKTAPSRATKSGSQNVDSGGEAPRKPGRPKTGTPISASTGSPAPKKDHIWWETKVIWEMMQKAQIQGLVSPDNMTVEGFAKIMIRKFQVNDEKLAADYIRAHASSLMYMMSHKRRPAVEWTEQPVYVELTDVRLSAAALKRSTELGLRPRKIPLPDPEPLQDDPNSSSSEDVIIVPRRARKGRSSILRPKGSNLSSKGETRSGKSYHRSSGDEDDDTDVPDVASPTKRKVEADSENTRRKRTSSRTQVQVSQGISPPDSDEDEPKTEMLPLRWRTPQSSHKTLASTPGFVPTLVAEPSPSVEANSPGDVWRCTHDGCVHKVYGASTDASQVLIAEHLDEHDSKRKEAIELVRSEELRSNLPVSNLIKRIREMADAQQTMLQMGLSGSVSSPEAQLFPQPIRRQY